MSKIVTVLGARPQFVKASIVSRAIEETRALSEIVVHTGQHFDANMSEVFFRELSMRKPDHHLGIGGGLHGAMTGRMLEGIESVLLVEQPKAVIVYGDTNSTLAGALAAAKLHIPVAHVEAGLRSFNMRMPEEVNRILTDRLSNWLFTPSAAAVQHLLREGVRSDLIRPVGDVMYDVALHFGQLAVASGGILARLGEVAGGYILVTVHRAENTDDPLRLAVIMSALMRCAQTLPVIWPLHPRTRLALIRQNKLAGLVAAGVRLIDPVGYLEMVELEKCAALIATDSGGVQKEAYFHQVPCVTLRDETEWVELIESGWNRLAPPDDANKVASVILEALGTRGRDGAIYGKGDASKRIAVQLAADLG